MRYWITITLLVMGQWLVAQPAHLYRQQLYLPQVAVDAVADNLGNLYLVNAEGQVKKLGSSGDSVAVFNSVRRNGKLFSMDVSNPLRVQLFYRDFAQVVVLDRLLAPQLTLDLRRSGMLQPSAVGLSFDNKIWVFDAVTQQLKKVDDGGKVLQETPDLRAVLPDGIQPVRIIDHNSWVYLYDPAQGLFVFDYFGNFKRKMPLKGWGAIAVAGDAVYGIKDGALRHYAVSTLMETTYPLPDALKNCSHFRMDGNRLVAVCAAGVYVYRLQ